MDELLVMALQRYEEQDEQNSIVDRCKVDCILRDQDKHGKNTHSWVWKR